MKRIWLLLALLLCLTLASCTSKTEDGGDTTKGETEAPLVDLIDAATENFIIIRPDLAKDTVKKGSMRLRDTINDTVGSRIRLSTDLDTDEDPAVYEILVGKTNRAASAEAIASLKEGEYVIKLVGEKTIVLAGYEDAGTLRAINVFLSAFLKPEGVQVPSDLMLVGQAYLGPESHEDGTISLIGNGPTKYRIVYASSDLSSMRTVAQDLADAINTATGNSAETGAVVVSDAEAAAEEGVPEILVGNTNRPATATVKGELEDGKYAIKLIDQTTLVLVGSDERGTSRAVKALIESALPYNEEEEKYQVNRLQISQTLSIIGDTVDPAIKHHLGLQIASDGTILLGGKEYQAIGVNWHGPFNLMYNCPQDVDFDKYFQTLVDNKIPYIRIMMGVFYPDEYNAYVNNKSRYFKAMDDLVKLAEEYQIGIIASLMWNYGAVCEYNNEKSTALTDPDSKSIRFARQYVSDVVSRYKDSPALWAWEIGNEGNLDADIQPGFTTEVLNAYYRLISQTIASLDGSRMITGGDSYPRAPSKALRENGSWNPNDTREDVIETFGYYTPDPMNAISVHIYGIEGSNEYIYDCIRDFRAKADELKIGGFVGEFGPGEKGFHNPLDQIGPDDPREAEEQRFWKGMVDLMIESDIQLLCAWSYGRYIQQAEDGTSIEYGMLDGVYQNAYMIDYIREVNTRLEADGNNCSADYWKSVK